MARDFHYYPRSFAIPSLEEIRTQWANIPFERLRRTIAIEHQYLHFHCFMMKNTRNTRPGDLPNDGTYTLFLTVRAVAIKAALLICASIIEAALLAHALKRRYKQLPKNSKSRTFGTVIEVWKADMQGQIELNQVISAIEKLCGIRNHIHLEKIADSDEERFYSNMVDQEESFLQEVLQQVMQHLQSLRSE